MSADRPGSRPAKPPLSRAAIVAATLALVDEAGYAAVSMRRVAQALDTGPASLYVHVTDRTELMAAAYDLALAGVAVPTGSDGDWRARLELLTARAVAALGSHDDLASIAFAEVPAGPHARRVAEGIRTLLRAGGIDGVARSWAADLIGAHITSSALEHAARRRDRRAAPPAGSAPSAHPPHPEPTGGDRDAWRLRVLIDGLLAQRR